MEEQGRSGARVAEGSTQPRQGVRAAARRIERPEEALERAERKFQRLFESNIVGVVLADVHGSLTDANAAFLEMLGYGPGDLPLRWDAMTPTEWRHRDEAAIEQVLTQGAAHPWEKEFIARDGRRVPVLVTVVALLEGAAGDCMAIVLDLSERKQAERKIITQSQRLRALTVERTLTEERVRRRIAVGLHDDLGQTLAVVKVRLDALRSTGDGGAVEETVDGLRDLIDQAIQSTRSLTFELSSPVLHALGLEPALETLGERLEQDSPTRFRFESDHAPRHLAKETSVVLYGVVRELIHNVAKHAQARCVELSVRSLGHRIELTVEDDGVGFDAGTEDESFAKSGNFGLFSAREQLAHVGGCLELTSSPGEGARAVVTAPLGPFQAAGM